MNGIFTISLDFELHWGVFDKKDRLAREKCYRNTLALIPKLLELFAAHGVHVSWACVGSLFAKDHPGWEQMKPAIEPSYENQNYSPYDWVRQHGIEPSMHWAHFAPQLISLIREYPGQELASHTFGHYYCLEPQSNPGAFSADLQAAQNAAAAYQTSLTSLVFPRNQFNPEVLSTCFANGIRTVRSNPKSWFWSPVQNTGSSIIRKIVRTGDAYLQIGADRTSYPLKDIPVLEGLPLCLPASRFLRPWNPRYAFANNWRLGRICQELKTAAIKNECYHLWWHPENFGEHPQENLASLSQLLQRYTKLRGKYGMQSWNMGEYAKNLQGEVVQMTKQQHVGESGYSN